ncbi:MAG TPA: bifunctional 5,10-methylenetetrahydrofolate dehydrogenase/5,10-methenyltetrahydrofolate cyclohydrolase, partial [Planctomycetota bacterium]|nr:bifunctional 5,10-methylenetetrahydrofolate dehydrogenase/5,10-methenyltetrahydrofolate cyclohydrolase [Planctomycetota bacterium]
IAPEKDVDGFHPINVGKVLIGDPDGFAPCTPAGVQLLLKEYGVDTAGKHVVIIGRSNIVGKPMAALLMQHGKGGDATVTVCHSRTPDLSWHTKRADIVIAAMGRPGTVTGDMVKPGAVVIDVGINETPDGKLVGDVVFDEAKEVAGVITPVPGGVGPVCHTILLRNIVACARRS